MQKYNNIMSRQVDVKALVSHIVRGDGADRCRICMGSTEDGQVFLGDTVMLDSEKPVTLAELLHTVTGVEVVLDDDLPSGLCAKCAASAVDAGNFRELSHMSQEKWLQSIETLETFHWTATKDKPLYLIINGSDVTVVHIDNLETKISVKKEKYISKKTSGLECTDCGKQFNYPYSFYIHLESSTDMKRACPVCAEIMEENHLVAHLEKHKIKPIFCNSCPAILIKESQYEKHKRKFHNSGEFSCGQCQRRFQSSLSLNAHNVKHSSKSCARCNKEFINYSCFLHHFKSCCGDEIRNAGLKKKVTIKNIKSQRQMSVGLRGSVFKECYCDYCGKKFSGKKFVNAHIQIVHMKNTHRPCPYCGKSFAAARMSEHIKSHEKTKTFTCEHCGLELKSKLGFTQHQRLHTGELPYKCRFCTERFSASSRRSDHIKKCHSTVEIDLKHGCQHCPAKFRLPYMLRKHISTAHAKESDKGPQFKCKICLESFGSCRGLVHHSRKHQSLKKYSKATVKLRNM